MSERDSEDFSKIPEPSDSGISGSQNDAHLILSIPENYPTGGLSPSPISQGFQHFVTHSPEHLGSLPTFMYGVYQESVHEKKRLDAKLQEYETKISSLSDEVSKLKEKNAVLRATLNAESRLKLMRNASITGGMMVLGFGFKLTETTATVYVGYGLILVGGIFAVFGWLSRIAKEVE